MNTVMSRAAMESKPRPRIWRYVALALAILVAPVFAVAATVAAAVATTGMMTVDLRQGQGSSVYVPLPAGLIDLAVFATPHLMPSPELARLRAEIAPYRDGLEELAMALEDCPDGTLVEVVSRREEVLIAKDGRNFRVEVRDAEVDLTVTIPARLFARVLTIAG